MPAMMAGATAFVMPSRREALGLVYLEAFRAGVPVISGRDGGVSDIVIDGENGLAVPTEDAAALAQAIITLVTDTELSKRLVAGGAQTLAERTAVRLIDETLRVYDEVTVSSSEASMHSAPPASASHAEPVASSRTPKKRARLQGGGLCRKSTALVDSTYGRLRAQEARDCMEDGSAEKVPL